MKTIRQLFLFLSAKCFELISRLYHYAWDKGIFHPEKAPIPIVSIGNLAIGGVGKTPLTIFLANELALQNTHVAIASRGYRSKWENSRVAKRVDPEVTDPRECGDEPLLMAKKAPKCTVWITKRRIESAREAARDGAEILLLDDGMQHRKIEKDFEIVLLNCKSPFGAFFPLGRLREHPSRLKNAQLIALMNCDSEAGYLASVKLVREYSKAPIVGFISQIDPIPYRKIAVLTAIADPKRFLDLLKLQGAAIVLNLNLRDHSHFKNKMIEDFAKEATERGAEAIICTEKDHVKIESPLKSVLPIIPVPLEISPIYDKGNWDKALSEIIRLLKRE